MADKPKIDAKIITIPEGRVSFLRTEASYRKDKFGREIRQRPDGTAVKPRWSMTWLLDPSSAIVKPVIEEIKAEGLRIADLFFGGRDKWPKDNPVTGTKGVLFCFGYADKLPKVYDGYAGMFYVKVSDTTEPIWGDRLGRSVRFNQSDNGWHVLDRQTNLPTEETVDPGTAPYSGAWCRGRISMYPYNNESAGINSNFRGVQFLRSGAAFGGGGARSAAEELAEMSGDAPAAAAPSQPQKDPWD